MGKNVLFPYTKPTKMKGFQEKTAYLRENVLRLICVVHGPMYGHVISCSVKSLRK